MNNKPEIICCGHAAYDLNFIMDEYPEEDQKYKIDKLIQTGGGPASNAACLLSSWGIRTAYAGLIGDDIYGRLILDELTASGVDTSLIQIDPSKNTPLSAVIVNTATGSRTLLNRRNTADQPRVTPEIIGKLIKMKPAILHLDGHALDLSLEMMKLHPDSRVVVDAGSFRDATDRLCSAAEYPICSRRYAEDCTGLDDIQSEPGRRRCMNLLEKKYSGRIVVTLGADGLFYNSKTGGSGTSQGRVSGLEAFRVDALDSTGAGDIFHAAFSYGLLKGVEFRQNLLLASAAAALSVTKPGGRTSIPGLEESLKLAGL